MAVDLQRIEPIPAVKIVQGDVRQTETLDRARAELGGPADVVLSDMSPQATGIALTDQARAIELAQASLAAAEQTLRPGGSFVVKAFRGADFDVFLQAVRQRFKTARIATPEATRKESREVYVVGLGFRGGDQSPTAPRAKNEQAVPGHPETACS